MDVDASSPETGDVDANVSTEVPPPPADTAVAQEPQRIVSSARFATPLMVFSHHRVSSLGTSRPQPALGPRTLRVFLAAAKSHSDALLSAHPIHLRLATMDFQPRRSAQIAGQLAGSIRSSASDAT